uniref:Uncharacterized protein n=1 Tax=Arundo donax TaxID=35708 RepID=A0A0A8ZUL5_ARUDO
MIDWKEKELYANVCSINMPFFSFYEPTAPVTEVQSQGRRAAIFMHLLPLI